MNRFNIVAGRIIRQKRKEARMTQTDVAKKIGLRQTAVSNIEIGQNGMDLELYKSICRAIGCDIYETLAEIYNIIDNEGGGETE